MSSEKGEEGGGIIKVKKGSGDASCVMRRSYEIRDLKSEKFCFCFSPRSLFLSFFLSSFLPFFHLVGSE